MDLGTHGRLATGNSDGEHSTGADGFCAAMTARDDLSTDLTAQFLAQEIWNRADTYAENFGSGGER
jgi:hypothetical protein